MPSGASVSATFNTKGPQLVSVQYVGMDVDKQKIVRARLSAGRETQAVEQVIANTPSAVKKYFASLMSEAEVHATYEAGCFGVGLQLGSGLAERPAQFVSGCGSRRVHRG